MKQKSKPSAIIIDLDGTLSDMDKRRHYLERCPPDFDTFNAACLGDPPNDWCVKIARAFAAYGVKILIVSARAGERVNIHVDGRKVLDTTGWSDTMAWLKTYEVPYDQVYLRTNSYDKRTDVEVKQDIYKRLIKPRYNVLFAIDDKLRIAQLWRKLGLVCLHCAEGDTPW